MGGQGILSPRTCAFPQRAQFAPHSVRRSRRIASIVVGLTLGLGSLGVVSPPAHAADDDGYNAANAENCGGTFECLSFHSGYEGQDNSGNPSLAAGTGTTYDLIPVTEAPTGDDTDSSEPWQGTFLLHKHLSGTGNDSVCLSTDHGSGSDGLHEVSCVTTSPNTAHDDLRWYVEPVTNVRTGTTSINGASVPDWFPWWKGASGTFTDRSMRFYLRSAEDAGESRDRSSQYVYTDWNGLRGGTRGLDTAPHGNYSEFALDNSGPVQKSLAQQTTIANYLLAAAMAHAASTCADTPDNCSVQVTDALATGTGAADWQRVSEAAFTGNPTIVNYALGCAGSGSSAGSAQILYNGGSAPMDTSITVSGTSEYSSQFSVGLEVSAEFGADFPGIYEAKFTITASTSFAKTWTTSQTLEQSVNWTIPAHHYATAVLSGQEIKLTAAYRFGTNSKYDHVWQTDKAQTLTFPASTDTKAPSPTSVISIYNSVNKKNCTADGPTTLKSGTSLAVVNDTTTGASPVVGDELSTTAKAEQWEGASVVPVNLFYQWYRQRGDADPIAIQGANASTYTVTSDDVTPSDEASMGQYHLFAGVTDIANATRFDSDEYRTFKTGATAAERSAAGQADPTFETALPAGAVGDFYDGPTVAVAGSNTPSFSAAGLPTGLSINAATGEITGYPQRSGSYTVVVTDATSRTRATFTLVVSPPAHPVTPTVAVSTGASGVSGAPTTITAQVSAPALTGADLSGTATFTAIPFTSGSPTSLGSAPVSAAGAASLSASLPAGSYQIEVTYTPAGDLLTSASGSTTFSVAKSAPVIQVAALPAGATSAANTEVDITAVVASSGAPYPGTLVLRADGNPVRSDIVVGSNGAARLFLNIARGSHVLDVTTAGTDQVSAGLSNAIGYTAVGLSSSVTLDGISAGSIGTAPLLTARVAAADHANGTPTGTVTFYDGNGRISSAIGLDDEGVATFKVPTYTAISTHSYSARYSGDATYLPASSAATEQAVGLRPAVTTLSLAHEPARSGQRQTVTASVGQLDLPGSHPGTGSIEFTVDGRRVATVPVNGSGVAAWSTRTLKTAAHQVVARYSPIAGSEWGASLSASTRFAVIQNATAVRIRTNCSTSCRSTTRATITVSPVTKARHSLKGTVRVLVNGHKVKTLTLNSKGKASLTVRKLAKGTDAIVVVYPALEVVGAGVLRFGGDEDGGAQTLTTDAGRSLSDPPGSSGSAPCLLPRKGCDSRGG